MDKVFLNNAFMGKNWVPTQWCCLSHKQKEYDYVGVSGATAFTMVITPR